MLYISYINCQFSFCHAHMFNEDNGDKCFRGFKIRVNVPRMFLMQKFNNREVGTGYFDNWNQMFIASEDQHENYSILASAVLNAKENISTCSHVAISWRPIASGLCSSTFPIVYPTSYTPLSSGCCSTLMHALFRRCIHSLFMSWSIDVNRPRSVSEHVAMAESESGGQAKYIRWRAGPSQRNVASRAM